MSSLNYNNLVCTYCGAEYYSASPYFTEDSYCEKCKRRDLRQVVKTEQKEEGKEIEDHRSRST